jgi:hypothetical protein
MAKYYKAVRAVGELIFSTWSLYNRKELAIVDGGTSPECTF